MDRRFPVVALVALAACDPDLDLTRTESVPTNATMGAILYGEACQRVAFIAELDACPDTSAGCTVDVSGHKYHDMCLDDGPAPADAPAKAVAMKKERPIIVPAVDGILPKTLLAPLDNFLTAIVPLDDDGTMTNMVDKTAAVLAQFRDDASFTAALARLGVRDGYRPTSVAGGVAPALVKYADLDKMLGQQLDLIGPKGVAHAELEALLGALSHELAGAVALGNGDAMDGGRTLRLALDLVLSSNPGFRDGTPKYVAQRDWRGLATVALDGSGKMPAPFVDADGDGLADVDASGHFVDANGKPLAVPSPFPVAGAQDSATRDAAGRALDGNGNPIYHYVDLDPTLLDGFLHDTASLADPTKDALIGAAYGVGALLGPRKMTTKTWPTGSGLTYDGFDTSHAALLDLTHGFVQLLGYDGIQDVLSVARTLVVGNEDATTRAVAAMLDASDRGKLHPEAQIPSQSDLFDDLVPLIVRTLKVPGLAADVMSALEDPRVQGLAPALAAQMTYADRFTLNQDNFDAPFSQSVSGGWNTKVDRTKPDSDLSRTNYNRSIMERMAHLIHDANGLQFCNKQGATIDVAGLINIGNYPRCGMFKVDDLALFYVLSMADRSITMDPNRYDTTYSKASFREALQDPVLLAVMGDNSFTDDLLQGSLMTNIDGFTRFPTPEALNRSLFLDQAHQSGFMNATIDPPTCNDGDRFIDVHNDSIFAWEAPIPGRGQQNFYDAVQPLVNAFAKHDECIAYDGRGTCMKQQNAAKIFVDLMSVLHEHWASQKSTNMGHGYQSSSPKSARYTTGDGVVTYEPLIAEVLSNDLVPSLINLTTVIDHLDVAGVGPARPVLLAAASFIFDPDAAPGWLTYRDGSTMATQSDGVTPAGRLTPYYLIADAYAHKRAALASAPADQAGAWRGAASALVDQFLGVDSSSGHKFSDRRVPPTIAAVVDFVKARLQAHATAGDLVTWVSQTLDGDIADTVNGPILAALVDFSGKLEAADDARNGLYALLQYLFDASQPAFSSVVTSVGDLLQSALDDPDLVPVGHAIGAALDPQDGALDAQLSMLAGAKKLDPNCPANGKGKECTLTTVMRNLWSTTPRGTSAIGDLGDAISEVHRTSPGAGTDLSAADYKSIFDNVYVFFNDKDRGFRRFVCIIKSRNSTTPSPDCAN